MTSGFIVPGKLRKIKAKRRVERTWFKFVAMAESGVVREEGKGNVRELKRSGKLVFRRL